MKKTLNWMLALVTSLTMISIYACNENEATEYVYDGVILERQTPNDDEVALDDGSLDDGDLDLEDQKEE